MNLVIDGHRLVQARTGVGRYLERLLHHWAQIDVPFDEVHCLVPRDLPDPLDLPSPRLGVTVARPSLPTLLWQNGPLRWRARRADLFFGASYAAPLWLHTPSVISNLGIYESQPGTFPWWHRWRYSEVYRHSARRASLVIANSESTRRDIVTYYGLPAERIRVVYPGVDEVFGPVNDQAELHARTAAITGFDEPFFLMVGKLSARRHIPMLLEAFARYRASAMGRERLLIVGPNHLHIPIEELIAGTGMADQISYRTHLPQTDLRYLYASATAFVLPTTHEGFSFTILEALACGAPVITMDHPPLREGLYDAVIALPQGGVEAFADAMARVAGDDTLRADLSSQGLACAKRFSWRRAAQETMDVLWEAVSR